MKRIIILLGLFLLPVCALGQNGALPVYDCYQGGVQVKTSGLPSTNYVQGIIPYCTVTVYLTGTTTLATIYSNSTGTVLNNPFTANAQGTFLAYAAANQGYDVTLSGGFYPNTFTIPRTFTDVFPSSFIDGCVTSLTNYFLLANAGPCINAELQQGSDLGIFSTGQPDYGQGTLTTYGFYGSVNGGLATDAATLTTPALKQDSRLCQDVSVSTSGGVTTLTSTCANFTTADNARVALLYPQTGLYNLSIGSGSPSGWAQNDRCTLAGGTGGVVMVLAVAAGVPTTVQTLNAGTGYAVASNQSCTAISPSTGTGLTVNVLSVAGAARSYTGGITVTNATTATTNSAYSGSNTTGATMILGTDDGAAFNALANTIPAGSAISPIDLSNKPLLTTIPLVVSGRGAEVKGGGLMSGLLAGKTPAQASGTTIIWAGAAHPVTLSVSGTTVTLTDAAGHGFYGGFCNQLGSNCTVNVQGTTQAALSGTFVITNNSAMTANTLTYTAPLATSGSDSGYMPYSDVFKCGGSYGCSIHDVNIMGSDQPSTKPRALIDTVDGSAYGTLPNSLNDIYNITAGNLLGFGNLPGNAFLSDSTAQYFILTDPKNEQDDRNNVRNVHATNVDICFGFIHPQAADWTLVGTNGCYFSGAAFAMTSGAQIHVSGAQENLQDGVDYLIGRGSVLTVNNSSDETDGPARVAAPIVGNNAPSDGSPNSAMLVEGMGYVNGIPNGYLTIDHGIFPTSSHLPSGGQVAWTNANGISLVFNNFTLGAGQQSVSTTPGLFDFSTVNIGSSMHCGVCNGINLSNLKFPTPGSGAANHINVVDLDEPYTAGSTAPIHAACISAGNDSTACALTRVDVPGSIRAMGGNLDVPQLLPPSTVSTPVCAGTPGSTTYLYKFTSVNAIGKESLPTGEYSTASTCPATVSATNSISGIASPVTGAEKINVYRTVANGATGTEHFALSVPANSYTGQVSPAGVFGEFIDTVPDGSLGTATPPTVNATGRVRLAYIAPIVSTVTQGSACPENGIVWMGQDGTTGICESNVIGPWPANISPPVFTVTAGTGMGSGGSFSAPVPYTATGVRATVFGGIYVFTTGNAGVSGNDLLNFADSRGGHATPCGFNGGGNLASQSLNLYQAGISVPSFAVDAVNTVSPNTTYYVGYVCSSAP